MSKIESLNTELTQSVQNLDKVRDLFRDGEIDWLIVVYQQDGQMCQRVWSEDVDVVTSCVMQGALLNARDYVSQLVAEEGEV